MVLLFLKYALCRALTLLSAPVFFEIGNTLFDRINQQFEISPLKCIY